MLKAKPGREAEAEVFLKQRAEAARTEATTNTWYGVRITHGVYAVFGTFHDQEGREAHLHGDVATALMARAPELFSNVLQVEKMDVLATKDSAVFN
jgi:quinol monooxygenase YgiN